MRSAWTARKSSTPSTRRSPTSAPRTAGACRSTPTALRGFKAVNDLIDADTGEVVVEAGKKITARQARQLAEKGLKALKATDEDLLRPLYRRGHRQREDRRDFRRGRRRDQREAAEDADRGRLQRIADPRHRPRQRRRLYPQHARRRQERDREDALFDIYRVMRPGEPPTVDTAEAMFLAVLRRRALRPLGYNRWGQLVFVTHNWKNGWDGTINGKDQPAGVYIWFLHFKDRRFRIDP